MEIERPDETYSRRVQRQENLQDGEVCLNQLSCIPKTISLKGVDRADTDADIYMLALL